MNPLAIIAWYGVLLIGGSWGLVGPYDNREECTSVIEWLDHQGYETELCTMIDTGVEPTWRPLYRTTSADTDE